MTGRLIAAVSFALSIGIYFAITVRRKANKKTSVNLCALCALCGKIEGTGIGAGVVCSGR